MIQRKLQEAALLIKYISNCIKVLLGSSSNKLSKTDAVIFCYFLELKSFDIFAHILQLNMSIMCIALPLDRTCEDHCSPIFHIFAVVVFLQVRRCVRAAFMANYNVHNQYLQG